MQLYLDTTDGEHIHLALARGEKIVAKKTLAAKYRQSEKLLREIEKLLQKAMTRSMRSLLTGIVVTKGPGMFTATRIGVTTANALGYALNIPVVGVMRDTYHDVHEWVTVGARVLGRKKTFRNALLVEPVYNGEPNITVPKT
jgi:tRNA threonylcarbamoyl adenosine modification protein YeaZ